MKEINALGIDQRTKNIDGLALKIKEIEALFTTQLLEQIKLLANAIRKSPEPSFEEEPVDLDSYFRLLKNNDKLLKSHQRKFVDSILGIGLDRITKNSALASPLVA